MHAQPPRTLKRLLKQYGRELIDDPRRTEALLRDLCGQHTREIFVLVNAQKQHVPNDLIAAPAWMPRQATYSRLSRTLQTKLALTEDAADWAVTAWAAALELDVLPKGDGWSWLPDPLRGPAPKSSRKSTSKKRQNSASRVQSSKVTTSSSVRKAKERAARAEMGWGLPKLALPTLSQFSLQQFSLSRFLKVPINWANLLPWVALLTATIFLLAVVYWTSATRTVVERDMSALPTTAESSVATTVETNDEFEAGAPTVSATNVTPLPELPLPAGHYLSTVMPPPIWANVNAEDSLNVRNAPSTDANSLRILTDGKPVHVISYSDDGQWSEIDNPITGWVSTKFLHFIDDYATITYVTLDAQPRRAHEDGEVNVYSEPHSDATITSTLSPDESVVVAAVLGEPATWYQIADPVVGWVAASDLVPVSP